MNIDIIKILVSIGLSSIIGFEREKSDKPAGLRTIIFISLGATLIVIFSLKYAKISSINFDSIRAIAYYLVAIGFVGGGIVSKSKNTSDGVTTCALLLPMTIIGLFCGIGDFYFATIITLVIFLVLMLKYIKIKLKLKLNGGKHVKKKIKSRNYNS